MSDKVEQAFAQLKAKPKPLAKSNVTTTTKPPHKSPYLINPITAFYLFALAHTLAAFYSPIQDCDEVYNYWEPTHYLSHGYGMQTWEYSPEYAIRSWLYASFHAVIISFGRLFFLRSKTAEFYFLRIILGLVCAACESRLYTVVSRTLNPRIGVLFIITMLTAPGMFHASIAYLPSSFTMYTTMLGVQAFTDWSKGLRTSQGMMWMLGGAVIGWPFAGVLAMPFILEDLTLSLLIQQGFDSFRRLLDGTVRSLLAVALESAIDSFFYKFLVCVPLNILTYNMFSGAGKGPNIYGTEPWDFYIRNLLLNFNIWFPLALAAGPLLFLQRLLTEQSPTKQSFLRTIILVSPLYMWLTIFTLQPHKEERFMYPIYPIIALNASISCHILLCFIGSTNPRNPVTLIPAKLRLVLVSLFLLLTIDISILRTLGTITAYNAPLHVYTPLQNSSLAHPGDTLCLGKEWHRYPSSYFLPNGMRAKFVKSAFNGLLPGEFNEAKVGFGFFPGAWLVPPGMNDENKEDSGKYTDIAHCSFLVDSQLPGSPATDLEPDYIADTTTWEEVKCHRFLDASQTSTLGRLLWLPDAAWVPERYRRQWGSFVGSPTNVNSPNPPLYPRMEDITTHARDYLHRDGLAAIIHTCLPHAKPALYLLLALGICIWFIKLVLAHLKRPAQQRPRSPDLEKPSRLPHRIKPEDREPGGKPSLSFHSRKHPPTSTNRNIVWQPSPFRRPPAPAYPCWSLTHTKPLPYRPFRYGPKYSINMGLRTMHWDEWIELDSHYPKFHAEKAARIAERGSKCCKTAPEACEAAYELLEELCAYLCERYPSLYRRIDGESRVGDGVIGMGIENLWSGERFDISERPLKEDPMQMAARLVQDDLVIMMERPDGQYYLLAGAILLPGFWRLEDKFGMPLSEIHTSGEVPQFKEKLEKGMMSLFRRMKPEAPVLRNNYFIQVDDSLAWSHSIGGEDDEGIGWSTAEKNRAIQHHFFRSERQSLRRLPRTGGVVFTIRTYFHPITEICEEPYVPGRLASAIRSWGDDVSRYKGKERFQDVLLEYLDRKHEEQAANGLDLTKEDEVRAYPY